MTKFLAAAMAGIAAALLAGPLLAAVLLSTVAAPAVGTTIACLDQTSGSGANVGEEGWRAPFEQPYTVSRRGFGRHFHPVHHEWRHHSGQDLVAHPSAGTAAPVVAVAAGVVTRAGRAGGYGNVVDIDHGDGISTRYAHLATIDPAVTPDTGVHAGQHLGTEGSTGVSTGNHLHFEVHRNGTAIDPVPFMAAQGAPLDGTTPPTDSPPSARALDGQVQPVAAGALEGGVGFELPPPGQPRKASLVNPPTPIPADVEALYRAAAEEYALPWTVLAGVGMAETNHGRYLGRHGGTSLAGAQGLMQFLPSTWASMGVDGDGDGRADIGNDTDSVYSAAHYLTRSGLNDGPDGVRDALYAYNRADWYVNDVLHYAHAYGGGTVPTVLGDLTDCGPGATHPGNTGDPTLTPLSNERVTTMLAWAHAQTGEPYVFGANGPDAWDCSSFTRTALAQVGISAPRTAAAQRDWLAAGNGHRVQPGQERAGDMVFWDSYLGPDRIGHVMLVADPTTQTTIESRSRRHGVGSFSYASGSEHHRFEIWRVGDVSDGTTLVE